MRLRIVARSLGIILASPLIALPTWLAGDGGLVGDGLVAKGFAKEAPASVVQPPKLEAQQVVRETPPVVAPAADPVVEVSVTCGQRGCVVLQGLEVTVVEDRR